MTPGEAWRDGHESAFREAAAWASGMAAGSDDSKVRAAMWRAYEHYTEQADHTASLSLSEESS